MPIYEYVCFDCNNKFDALRPMRDADKPIKCKNCQGDHTSRAISLFSARSSSGATIAGSGGGCAGCAANSCAGCGS